MNNLLSSEDKNRIKAYLSNIIKNYNINELECELRAGLPLYSFGGDTNSLNLSQFRNLEKFMDSLKLKKTSTTSLDITIKNSTTNPRISNLRFSLYGEDTISKYCKTNNLPTLRGWLGENKSNKALNFKSVLDIMYKGNLEWILKDDIDKANYESITADGYETKNNRANIDLNSIRTRFGGKVELNYNFLNKEFTTDISNDYLKTLKEHAASSYDNVNKMDFNQLFKTYRLKKRISYQLEIEGIAFTIDLTKVKTSKLDHNSQFVPALNIIDSELSLQNETYEYETEFKLYDSGKTEESSYDIILKFLDEVYIKSFEHIGITNIYTSKQEENKVIGIYKNVVSKILSSRIDNKLNAIKDLKLYNSHKKLDQNPESLSTMELINAKYPGAYEYYNILKNTSNAKLDILVDNYSKTRVSISTRRGEFRNNSAFYLSPKVISIDLHNIRPENSTSITHDYTVTDKADGYNMLLFQIGEDDTDEPDYINKIYMIDSNMVVYATNIVAKSSRGSYIFNGEYLPEDYKHNILNKYAIFDCYINNGKDVCMKALMNEDESIETRINYANKYMDNNKGLVKEIVHQLTDSLTDTTVESPNLKIGTKVILLNDRGGVRKGTEVKIIGIERDSVKSSTGVDEEYTDYTVITTREMSGDTHWSVSSAAESQGGDEVPPNTEGHKIIIVDKEDIIIPEVMDYLKHEEIKANNLQFGIFVKQFYIGSDKKIFEHSNKIWNDWESKKVNTSINSRYYLDGLIYTPASCPVGYIANKYDYDLKQGSGWPVNLKWKPPHDNTIDFLIRFDKEVVATRGSVKVTRDKIVKKATITSGETSYNEFISAKLYNGGNKKNNSNPCNKKQYTSNNNMEPIPFEPTNPSEEHVCNILIPVANVKKGYAIKKVPQDLDGNIIDDDTIVEVSYNNFISGTKNYEPCTGIRWSVLRTRHDKTFNYKLGLNEQKKQFLQIHKCVDIVNKYDKVSELKSYEAVHLERNIKRIKNDLRIKTPGSNFDIIKNYMTRIESYYNKQTVFKVNINYGNHSSVANNIWRTIHNPVTTDMIVTGDHIPSVTQEEEKYYKRDQRRDKSITLNLQNFHNKIIKSRILIKNACAYARNNGVDEISLLDMACGKGGDIPKWRDNNITTVVGIDCVHNNIDDVNDGACSRYNFYKSQSAKTDTAVPTSYFLVGDTGKSIMEGKSVTDSRYASIQNDLWNTTKYPNTNFSNTKFDIVSVMFAVHYFFKSEQILDTFISNIGDNIKPGGLLVGCCFDGQAIFDKLSGLQHNDYIEGMQNGAPIWRIKKKYKSIDFKADSSSIGMTVDVLIYSIGQLIEEYLVNFDLLKQKLAEIDMIPLSADEISELDWLPGNESIGTFESVFNKLSDMPGDSPLKKILSDMKLSSEEKALSFLFKYFIFKKKSVTENKLDILEKHIYSNLKMKRLVSKEAQHPKLKKLILSDHSVTYTEDVINSAISNTFVKVKKETLAKLEASGKGSGEEVKTTGVKVKMKVKVKAKTSVKKPAELK